MFKGEKRQQIERAVTYSVLNSKRCPCASGHGQVQGRKKKDQEPQLDGIKNLQTRKKRIKFKIRASG
jgi:hypothetical protein